MTRAGHCDRDEPGRCFLCQNKTSRVYLCQKKTAPRAADLARLASCKQLAIALVMLGCITAVEELAELTGPLRSGYVRRGSET